MRDIRKGVCPLCEANEIIESIVAEFANNNYESPMCVTYDARWVAEGRNPLHGHGPLRMYVCRDCGYTQWFADNSADIPIDAEHRTRLIKGPDSEGPYR
ncbi:MAG: hypothetical protein JKY56_06700 [Kofleriaceae bacterium]|nr:hypothetical protein [Kofleriaceae bacterium]